MKREIQKKIKDKVRDIIGQIDWTVFQGKQWYEGYSDGFDWFFVPESTTREQLGGEVHFTMDIFNDNCYLNFCDDECERTNLVSFLLEDGEWVYSDMNNILTLSEDQVEKLLHKDIFAMKRESDKLINLIANAGFDTFNDYCDYLYEMAFREVAKKLGKVKDYKGKAEDDKDNPSNTLDSQAFAVFVDKMDGDTYEGYESASHAVLHAFKNGANEVLIRKK